MSIKLNDGIKLMTILLKLNDNGNKIEYLIV